MIIKALRGTKDIVPGEIEVWQYIENTCREFFRNYSYKEIRTPIIEKSALFLRNIGETTDIVQKQMYTFIDKGGREISMRPEETACVARAFLENNLNNNSDLVKLYYMGPMFRNERPQAGRLRQFHQIGVEVLGSYNPYIDVEIIILLSELLKKIGVDEYEIKINNLGCKQDKIKISSFLQKQLSDEKANLCPDCQNRYGKNIFRVLDCKNKTCKNIIRNNVNITDNLCNNCKDNFNSVKKILTTTGIDYKIDECLVRGLDYYSGTVFEVINYKLGAQDAIAAGGRYDNLLSDMSGLKIGAVGFALGVERLIMTLDDTIVEKVISKYEKLDVFVITIPQDDYSYEQGFKLVNSLRKINISSDIDYNKRSIKSQMRTANKRKASFVVICGSEELKRGEVKIKDMSDGREEEVKLTDVVNTIIKKL